MTPTPAHADRRALAALIAGAIAIGFAPIFVRLIDVGLTAAAFWRAALALPILWLLWFPRRHAPDAGERTERRWLLLCGVFFAADLVFYHQAIAHTSVANATLMANLSPIFVAAASVWLFGEHLNRRFVVGLALALAGSAVLVANSFTISATTAMGDLLGVIASVFYAAYLLGVSRARRQTGVIELMWWSTLATALPLLPVTLALGEPLWPQSAGGWGVLLGLAFVSQICGQGLIAWGMAHLPASFSAVSLLLQPVAAAVFGWLILSESFGRMQALGGAIVLAGIVACRLAMPGRPAAENETHP